MVKMKINSKIWLKVFFIISTAMILFVSLFNYIINPYNIFEHGLDAKFKNKPEILSDEMTKFYVANHIKPKTIMIGTSRIGLFPENQLVPYLDAPIFNLGLPGSTIEEQIAYVDYMINKHDIKYIVWSLDFFSFNPDKSINPTFSALRLSDNIYYDDYLVSLFNFKTLNRSYKTIISNRSDQSINHTFTTGQPYSPTKVQSQINIVLKQYAHETNFLHSDKFKEPSSIDAKLTLFKAALKRCEQKKVVCYIYTSPVYYRHLDMIYFLGLDKTFEHWKKSLASIQSYTDFCTYSKLSHDPMQFRDSSHVIGDVGKLIFTKILDPHPEQVPLDFGIPVTSLNIETHLEQQRDLHHTFSF